MAWYALFAHVQDSLGICVCLENICVCRYVIVSCIFHIVLVLQYAIDIYERGSNFADAIVYGLSHIE